MPPPTWRTLCREILIGAFEPVVAAVGLPAPPSATITAAVTAPATARTHTPSTIAPLAPTRRHPIRRTVAQPRRSQAPAGPPGGGSVRHVSGAAYAPSIHGQCGLHPHAPAS